MCVCSTRILWSLSEYKQAPKFISKVNKNKVPINAMIITMLFSAGALVTSFLSPDVVYLFLKSVIGISNVFVYILYALCLMINRNRMKKAGISWDNLKWKVPLSTNSNRINYFMYYPIYWYVL